MKKSKSALNHKPLRGKDLSIIDSNPRKGLGWQKRKNKPQTGNMKFALTALYQTQ